MNSKLWWIAGGLLGVAALVTAGTKNFDYDEQLAIQVMLFNECHVRTGKVDECHGESADRYRQFQKLTRTEMIRTLSIACRSEATPECDKRATMLVDGMLRDTGKVPVGQFAIAN